MSNTGDFIYAENANWEFKGDVVKNFDEHVSKSIPLYHEGHDLILRISDFFLNDDSVAYELGCSTGSLLKKLVERNANKDVDFIGVDIEQDMVSAAQENCQKCEGLSFLVSDLMDVQWQKNDLMIAYYTMQFVKPKNRQIIFDRIYEALNWGGGFLLFEKVRAPDARFQDMMTAMYTDYKLDQGYKADEIVAKTRSLKGILEPFSTQGNLDLLKRAGFVDVMSIMKYGCFEGFLAIK